MQVTSAAFTSVSAPLSLRPLTCGLLRASNASSKRFRALAIGSMLFVAAAAHAESGGLIKLAVSEPLSGVNAYYGQQARLGTDLAIMEANAKGGIHGRKIVADYADNMCNPAEGVRTATQMLSSNQYTALLDGGCSSVALAMMPLAQRSSIPFVVANPSATSIADLSGVGGNKWTFKVNPSDATMLASLVDWLIKNGNTDRVAFLGENTDYGRGGAKALSDLLAAHGKKMLSPEYFEKGATDFSTVFARIKSENPTQLAIFAIGADTANLMLQWHDIGGGVPLTGRIQLEQIPKQIIGSAAFKDLSTVQPWDPSVSLPANQAFIASFQQFAKAAPTVNAWDSYEATRTVLAAIDKAGPDATPSKVRDALDSIQVPAMLGGMIGFDAHHLAHINAVVLTIKDGKVVVLGLNKT